MATDNDALSKCEPLSYNVMSIKEKIPFNNLLCNDVEGLVSSYFLYIKDLFKSLDNASFEAIASSFKHSYCQAVRQGAVLAKAESSLNLSNTRTERSRLQNRLLRLIGKHDRIRTAPSGRNASEEV